MVDRWTNPTTASLRGEDSRPLQQTFSSLSSYLEKLDNAITAAAASGVTSLTAGTGIGLSSGTGVVTVSNTGVTSLAGTANQVTVSAGTGGVTLSLPQNIHTGASPTFSSLTLNGGVSTYSAGNSSYITFGPNASWASYLRVGATPSVVGNSIAQVISTDGNLHLDSGTNQQIYLNYYSAGRPINVYGQINTTSNIVLGSHTLSSDTWRFRVTPNNYTSWYVELGEYYSRPSVRSPGGSLYLVGSGNVQIGIETNNRLAYFDTNGLYLEQGWFRPHGQTGIYFQSYGGGWWMTDTTWIRAYGDKNIYTAGEIRSNYPFSSNNTNNGANLRMISGNLTYFGWFGYYAQYVDSTHVKTFVIDHPTKPDNYLVHACAEGPTSDVFYRGQGQLQNGICVVTLPDYFEELTELEGRTIMVTPISDENGPAANLAAYEIQDGQFVVEQIGGFHVPYQRFWWRVDAVRKGTAFDVEPLKSETEVSGDGPYTYARKRAA
jgi:hypothetical protein